MKPGPRNLITDVEGILVGNAEDRRRRSGVTVILADPAAVAAVDVRGGGPGTRETDALDPVSLVETADAVVLSGGSAFGLDAAQGAMGWLAARGRGFAVGAARVPIVPAAVLFDLGNGGDKDWGEDPPYRALARAACDAAGADFALGNAGAGLGAKAGMLKGGLGSVSLVGDGGLQIGAVVAVNPVGSVVMPGPAPCFWAWAFERDGEFGALPPPRERVPAAEPPPVAAASPGANTTLGVVATNAILTRPEALRVAIMAQDGFARAIRPAHTPFDGDTLFVLATLRHEVQGHRPTRILHIGALAADCVARAVARGVYCAGSLGDKPGFREWAAGNGPSW